MTFFASLLTVLDAVEKTVSIIAGVIVLYQAFQVAYNKRKNHRD